MLNGWAASLTVAAKKAAEWIKAHQPLVQTIFQVGAAAVGIGAGLLLVGKGLSVVGGMFGTAARAIGIFGHLLGIVSMLLGAVLTPCGLVVAGIVALGAYFLSVTGQMGKAVDWLAETFGDLLKDCKEALGGISDAISAGDIFLAWKVVTSFMKLEWAKACLWFREQWEDFKTWFFKVSPGLAKGLINGFAAVATFFSDMVAAIMQTWNKAVTAIAHGLVDLAMKSPSSQAASLILGENPMDQAAGACHRNNAKPNSRPMRHQKRPAP